jgi:L-alanine-DL-glutamate epimerase-like enolase superfamily enzyme
MNDLGQMAQCSLPALKITAVETIPLHLPLAQPLKISTGGARDMLEVLIVKILTDHGITGIGETQAWRRQGGGEILPNLVCTVRNHFQPLLIGRSVFDVAGTLHVLNEAYANTLYAHAAVADALFDAAGKAAGLPVHKLLGGECRSKVRVGVILSIKDSVDALLQSAQDFYDQGYRYFGLKIGINARQDIVNASVLMLRADGDATGGRQRRIDA